MPIGFAPGEIDTAASTRSARLKWVIVVDASLPAGRAVNAAVCAAAATSSGVSGLLGPDAPDADGSVHVGLPWAGCSILVADTAVLAALRAKAEAHPEVFVADVPVAAQQTRVYDEFLASVAGSGSDSVEYLAVSLVGPRNRVDKIVGRLPLMP